MDSKGSLLIEPQPWKCYKSAEKRTRKLGMEKPKYWDALSLRNIEKDLVDFAMNSPDVSAKSYWCLGQEVWGRSIFLFHRSRIPSMDDIRGVATVEAGGDVIGTSIGALKHATVNACDIEGSESDKSKVALSSVVAQFATSTDTGAATDDADSSDRFSFRKKSKIN
jgi:hypothetical protein